MNRSETVYTAVSHIRSDYIEQAADYDFRKKGRVLKIGGVAAAACILLCIGVFGALHAPHASQKQAEAQAQISVPAEAAAEEATNANELSKPAEKVRIILYDDGPRDAMADEIVPDAGEIAIAPGLLSAVKTEDDPDALYAIDLIVFYHNGEWETYLNEAHDRYLQCWEDPAVLNYERMYADWLKNIYQPGTLDLAMEAKGADLSRERFAEYWAETASAADRNAYEEASARRQRAWDAYLNRVADSAAEKAMREADRTRELLRLSEAGIALSFDETANCLRGFLTKDQILQFPAHPSFGYQIHWTNREGITDE